MTELEDFEMSISITSDIIENLMNKHDMNIEEIAEEFSIMVQPAVKESILNYLNGNNKEVVIDD